LSDPRLVDPPATGAGDAVLRLAALNVPFARDEGTCDFPRLGSPGHSEKRFLRVEPGKGNSPDRGGLSFTIPKQVGRKQPRGPVIFSKNGFEIAAFRA
jgi:fumarate reductase (CoM/CoB) subunit A